MDDQQVELGQYLATLPYSLALDRNDPDLVVAAFDGDGRAITHTGLRWNPYLPHHNVANDLAHHLAKSLERQDEIARMLVIEYGRTGQDRSTWLVTALHGLLPVTPGQIHVQANTWRTQALTADGWGPTHPLPPDIIAADLTELAVTARALDQTLNPADPLTRPCSTSSNRTRPPRRSTPRPGHEPVSRCKP
ncbi:hypothetical protein C8K30_115118 [Promicromonospora sp. AC04]|uniref:hypothetical protein n=1 Tax=Promicromonospora sp. AC04 TaxID=2135723 RepID=UPI000D3ABFD5|nr:hypothetical protein [Promicromonospora sp. AC04]PUB20907.1 hypothetical protein C8K30_115118 [Promicromonospora sp. AC04]